MNKFWPNRPEPEGFSIEKLAKLSRENLAKLKYDEVSKPSQSDLLQVVDSTSIGSERTNNLEFLRDCSHWANRSFDEYREAS